MMYHIKLCILCVVLKYDISAAFPQNWPSYSNTNQGFMQQFGTLDDKQPFQKGSENKNFDWKGSSDQGSAWGSDADLETLSSKVLERYQVYCQI